MAAYNGLTDLRRRESRYKEALKFAEIYYNLAIDLDDHKFQQNGLKDLARIHNKLGNYKEAYKFRKNYDELRYERFNEKAIMDQERRIALNIDRKTQYENQQQQQKLVLQGTALAREKNFRYFLIGSAFSLLIILFLIFYQYRIKAEINKELKHKAEIIEKQNQGLKELDTLKGKLLKSVYHDLRFPAIKISDLSNYALSSSIDFHNIYQSSLKEIFNISKYINSLAETVLTIERVKLGKLNLDIKKHKVFDAVNEALGQITATHEIANIEYRNNISPGYFANFDFDNLVRVFVNLISNAENAINQKITKNKNSWGVISIRTEESNGQVSVFVDDNGIGVSKTFIESFNSGVFFDNKHMGKNRKIKSTGLGIEFCKLILEEHNSTLKVESNKNDGASFYFTMHLDQVEEKQFNEEFNLKRQITLTPDEKKYLINYIDKLKNVPFYRYTEIENSINKINPISENVSNWKLLLLKSLESQSFGKYSLALKSLKSENEN